MVFSSFLLKGESVIKLFPNESSFSLREKAWMRGENSK
jgi:hypothetical protein